MKVLQINSVCGYGSTGRIATDIYDILEREGHQCTIAYGRGNTQSKYKTIKIGNKIKVYKNVLLSRILDNEGFNAKKATINFIEEIKTLNPDIIHLHNLHGYYLNVEILFKFLKTLDIPIFWTLHDCWAFSPHSAYIEVDKNGFLPIISKRKEMKNYPKAILKNNSEENYEKKKEMFTSLKNLTLICPSEWLANLARNSFFSNHSIKVIHNGIDLENFRPVNTRFKQLDPLENKKVLLGVASVWEERKGLKYFNFLADKLDSTYQIVLVGVTKKEKKLIHPNILIISKTNNIKELAGIYTRADLFINPTLEDNFPTTNIESLACGTPVITFDTGGSPESLSTHTGIIIEKGNIKKLKEAIINFNYKFDYQDLCVSRAKNFDKEVIYKKYLDLYKKVNY